MLSDEFVELIRKNNFNLEIDKNHYIRLERVNINKKIENAFECDAEIDNIEY